MSKKFNLYSHVICSANSGLSFDLLTYYDFNFFKLFILIATLT
jgi:hypothetical protein